MARAIAVFWLSSGVSIVSPALWGIVTCNCAPRLDCGPRCEVVHVELPGCVNSDRPRLLLSRCGRGGNCKTRHELHSCRSTLDLDIDDIFERVVDAGNVCRIDEYVVVEGLDGVFGCNYVAGREFAVGLLAVFRLQSNEFHFVERFSDQVHPLPQWHGTVLVKLMELFGGPNCDSYLATAKGWGWWSAHASASSAAGGPRVQCTVQPIRPH